MWRMLLGGTLVASIVVSATPAPAGATGATLVGPVLNQSESSTVSDLTDTGITVPLPNGDDLWVFGDMASYAYKSGQWKVHSFVKGSNAAEGPYAQGTLPAPLDNLVINRPLEASNKPTQFIPAPTDAYMPNGTGELCDAADGAAYPNRWATGAALMPGGVDVLVTYVEGCVLSATDYSAEGWGFMEYDWQRNKIAVRPIDVFRPSTSGAPLAAADDFGSPIVQGDQLTMFSSSDCPSGTYTTMPATTAALENPSSYVLSAIPGFDSTGCGSVSQVAGAQSPSLQLVELTGAQGQFVVDTAQAVTGPWSQEASGVLPGCAGTPPGPNSLGCYSLEIHPELATTSELFISYVLPDYGPGVAGHPDAALGHLVLASVPL